MFSFDEFVRYIYDALFLLWIPKPIVRLLCVKYALPRQLLLIFHLCFGSAALSIADTVICVYRHCRLDILKIFSLFNSSKLVLEIINNVIFYDRPVGAVVQDVAIAAEVWGSIPGLLKSDTLLRLSFGAVLPKQEEPRHS